MKTYQRRLMDMFESVDQFGKKPELTLTAIITTLLAVVTAKLGAMRAWVAGQTNGQGHYREGAAERRGLKTAIYATLRDMREIAKGLELDGDIGVSDLFRLPVNPSYAMVLATARSFVTNATPMSAAFIARGMPATFLDDLEAKIAAFDTATGGKADGRSGQVGSTAALVVAGKDGLKAVQQLRSIMRVHLRPSPDLLAGWVSAARVETTARAEAAPPAPEPPASGS